LQPSGGGAIHVAGGQVQMMMGQFNGNSANGFGGAVIGQLATMRMETVTFDMNTASEAGGAIAANGTILQLAGSLFLDGNTAKEGYDIYIADDKNVSIDGTFVYCDVKMAVTFCSGIDSGAIFEVPGDKFVNTNCPKDGLDEFTNVVDCPKV
jgi:predicted outer membrane repeat protein